MSHLYDLIELFGEDLIDLFTREFLKNNQPLPVESQEFSRKIENPVGITGFGLVRECLPKSCLFNILHHIYSKEWFKTNNQHMIFGKMPKDLDQVVTLCTQLLSEFNVNVQFDQLISNYYSPGEGLVSHVDLVHKFKDGIAIISVHGTCTFEFKRNDTKKELFIKAGDLILLTGEARYEWSHGILAQKVDSNPNTTNLIERTERISISLRQLIPSIE